LAATVALLVIAVVGLVLALNSNRSVPEAQSVPAQMMTMDPRIIANLTALPKATPLAGAEANEMAGLQQMVEACDAYTAPRREQMIEQIGFIINPAQLSREVIIALGTNPQGRLLFALGQVTAIQWQLDKSPANSCLVPIGKRINQLLVAVGETPITIFEDRG
jgi:hypothetical protein